MFKETLIYEANSLPSMVVFQLTPKQGRAAMQIERPG
jgi:hypothetical protein